MTRRSRRARFCGSCGRIVPPTGRCSCRGHDFYATPEWRRIADAVRERDGHQCASGPGDCSGVLMVHHLTPRASGGQDAPRNLVTLCVHHHNQVEAAGPDSPLSLRLRGLAQVRSAGR